MWVPIVKTFFNSSSLYTICVSILFVNIGAASTSEESMGQTIMEALVEFVSEGQTNLQHVFLVIFQEKMVKPMLKGVRSGGQTASTGKSELLCSFTFKKLRRV